MEKVYKGFPTLYCKDPTAFRKWLQKNGSAIPQVWLVIFKKQSNTPSVTYDEAVDEALCFGWIDSKINKRDEESFYQFFSQRNPKSNWSAVNKKKVEKLLDAGKMTPAGLAMIALANNPAPGRRLTM